MILGENVAGAADRHPRADRSAYSILRQRIKDAGLQESQPLYYAGKFVVTMALLAVSLAILLAIRNPWIKLADAVFLAFVSTQIAFLGHDVAHHQVFRGKRFAVVAGLILGDLLLGISRAWWFSNHNAHHSNPNDVDHDPDIHIKVLAFTEDQARNVKGPARFFVKYQARFLFPLFCLENVSMHRNSVLMISSRSSVPYRRIEGILVAVHVLAYVLLVYWSLGLLVGLVFIAIHKALTGLYLGSVFAPNHKGMPVIDRKQRVGFLHRQVLTSRNVRANPAIDFLYGGLNYQIEHHLFPVMPRNRLTEAQSIVKSFCAEQGISYHETGMIQSYREILQSFRDVSMALR